MPPRKEAKIKSLFNDENYINYLNMVKSSKTPFTIKQSNYTLEIISDFINIQFMQNMMSDKAFIGNQMIVRDIKANNLITPDINRREIEYYKFQIPERLKYSKKTVWNIDIKSAYASILLNHYIITKPTFDYLQTLAKKDRLACVGMLAGKKNIFEYNNEGEIISFEVDENEMANFFYLCVSETQKIMNGLRNIAGDSFLFYWVDGIYFEDNNKAKEIQDFLETKNYRYSYDELTDFTFREKYSRYIIHFKKDNERKIFNVPKPNCEIAKQLIDILGLHSDVNLFHNQTTENGHT